eukprot:CAMPEP_0184666172 /NCGR_PEP_ID=MMETSP0308-20130426/60313_1 /TAXON_ID=38269 /ORGANISM="Gloeochaete witrockiana, Strain SAG 46.84" /LENGTH=184 /DNA_ID=CAMNT_0027110617 /DNA_START=63 /DNA_END=617 /DNA_ORIENTATION=+
MIQDLNTRIGKLETIVDDLKLDRDELKRQSEAADVSLEEKKILFEASLQAQQKLTDARGTLAAAYGTLTEVQRSLVAGSSQIHLGQMEKGGFLDLCLCGLRIFQLSVWGPIRDIHIGNHSPHSSICVPVSRETYFHSIGNDQLYYGNPERCSDNPVWYGGMGSSLDFHYEWCSVTESTGHLKMT